jgi:large subunit ribosomal protein L9
MKLILRADVDNLGSLGEVVTVKPGYGRNYLIPQGLAMIATAANLKGFELERKKLQAAADAQRADAQSMADKLAAAEVIIRVRVGDADRLYGSVTSAHIVDALTELGIELDRKKVLLSEPLRALGMYEIPVKLHPDVTSDLKVAVVAHNWVPGQPITSEEAAAAEAAEAVEADAEAEAQVGQAEEVGETEVVSETTADEAAFNDVATAEEDEE